MTIRLSVNVAEMPTEIRTRIDRKYHCGEIVIPSEIIGRGLFRKVNAFWKEGKERAVKMYEERAAVADAANGAPTSDGRPRWMRDCDHAGGEIGPLTILLEPRSQLSQHSQ
jgi:hypothetical protein